jgi:hypothetical protein
MKLGWSAGDASASGREQIKDEVLNGRDLIKKGKDPLKKYRTVNIREAQLEDLVRQAPEFIEDGMQFVDHQRSTTRGRLDVLLVDSGRALAVAELKVVEDDGMLMQALDYFDYVHARLTDIRCVTHGRSS